MVRAQFLQNTSYLPWVIAGSATLAVIIVILVILLVKRKKPSAPKRVINRSAYLEALGGADNVLTHLRKGSRIELQLRDYDIIDKEKIKEAGVDGFIKMSDRLTLVIKGDAEQVEKILFGSNDD